MSYTTIKCFIDILILLLHVAMNNGPGQRSLARRYFHLCDILIASKMMHSYREGLRELHGVGG